MRVVLICLFVPLVSDLRSAVWYGETREKSDWSRKKKKENEQEREKERRRERE